MAHLSVNVDYVAYIREARKTVEPDPVIAAGIIELAGAQGITAHLREDRRHIVDRDVRMLKETVQLPFNLEMAATDEIVAIACGIVPDLVTLVPERRREITTEGGLDVAGNKESLRRAVGRLKEKGMTVSMFIDPDPRQMDVSREIGADCVELHTGEYANTWPGNDADRHLAALVKGAKHGHAIGLEVHAGHGLTYKNISRVVAIREIEGYYIGHSIMARALYVGLDTAVRNMIALIKEEKG